MKSPLGFGLAICATASLAFAGGGEGEDKKKKKSKKKETPATESHSLLQGSWSGGAGKGITFDGGDNFSVRLKSLLQFSYVNNIRDRDDLGRSEADNQGLDIRRARTTLSGHLYSRDIKYKLQTEWKEDAPIKDAYIDYGFYNTEGYKMGILMGQGKSRFGRDFNTSAGSLEFVDRSLATRVFSNTRTRQLMLHGSAHGGSLAWSVAVTNGDMAGGAVNAHEEGDTRSFDIGNNQTDGGDDADNEVNYNIDVYYTSDPKAIRINSAQGDLATSQDFAWGAGAAVFFGNARHQPGVAKTAVVDVETTSYNGWVECRIQGLSLGAEYFDRTENSDGLPRDANGQGFHALATYVLPKAEEDSMQWGLGLRYAWIDFDDSPYLMGNSKVPLYRGLVGTKRLDNGNVGELELDINMFYHEHSMKTQLAFIWQNIAPDSPDKTGSSTADGTAVLDEDNFFIALQTSISF